MRKKDIEELGFDESTVDNLKKNGDKIINTLKKTGEIYQQNLNETGNPIEARILTLADMKVDHYTDASRRSSVAIDKIVNDDNNWTPTKGAINTPIPTNLKTATKLDSEILGWTAIKAELTAKLKEAKSKVEAGKESFAVKELERKIAIADNNINRVSEERNALDYSKEEQAADSKSFKFKPTLQKELNNSIKNKVINEYELADNLHSSEFYRTDAGKATLKKENYKVEEKKIEKEVKESVNAAELLDALDAADGTEYAKTTKKATEKKVAAVTPTIVDDEIPQTGVSQTEGLFTGEKATNVSPEVQLQIDKIK